MGFWYVLLMLAGLHDSVSCVASIVRFWLNPVRESSFTAMILVDVFEGKS